MAPPRSPPPQSAENRYGRTLGLCDQSGALSSAADPRPTRTRRCDSAPRCPMAATAPCQRQADSPSPYRLEASVLPSAECSHGNAARSISCSKPAMSGRIATVVTCRSFSAPRTTLRLVDVRDGAQTTSWRRSLQANASAWQPYSSHVRSRCRPLAPPCYPVPGTPGSPRAECLLAHRALTQLAEGRSRDHRNTCSPAPGLLSSGFISSRDVAQNHARPRRSQSRSAPSMPRAGITGPSSMRSPLNALRHGRSVNHDQWTQHGLGPRSVPHLTPPVSKPRLCR